MVSVKKIVMVTLVAVTMLGLAQSGTLESAPLMK